MTIAAYAQQLAQARAEAGLGLREVARRAGTSHATLHAYENGRKTPSIMTFTRILEACGYGVRLHLERRVRERAGMPRGEELRQVLELADQFPAQAKRQIAQQPLHRALS